MQKVLATRQKTHGPFDRYASVAQDMKDSLKPHIDKAPPFVKEGLDMIISKIARVATGDPIEPDHWLDIQGYALAVQNCLETSTKK